MCELSVGGYAKSPGSRATARDPGESIFPPRGGFLLGGFLMKGGEIVYIYIYIYIYIEREREGGSARVTKACATGTMAKHRQFS